MDREFDQTVSITALDESGNQVILTTIATIGLKENHQGGVFRNQRVKLFCPACNSKLHRIIPAAHLALTNESIKPIPAGASYECRKCGKQFKISS